MSDDDPLSVEADASDATAPAAAALLASLQQTIDERGDGYRYDVTVTVEEVSDGD